jgi:hypothetical protein
MSVSTPVDAFWLVLGQVKRSEPIAVSLTGLPRPPLCRNLNGNLELRLPSSRHRPLENRKKSHYLKGLVSAVGAIRRA